MNRETLSVKIRFAVVLFVWMLVTLFLISLRTVSDYWLEGELMPTWDYVQIIGYELLMAFAWATITPFVIRACTLVPRSKREVVTAGVRFAALFVWFIGIKTVFGLGFNYLTGEGVEFSLTILQGLALEWIELDLITFGFIILAGYTLVYYTKYRYQGLVQRRLERQLTTIEFDGLKMQAQPEFLIRTLQRVSATLDQAPDAAEEMVTLLSNLLRNTLMHANTEQVSLEEEISMFQDYLNMQKAGHPDFDYEVEVDPDAWPFKVPAMVLQPLVETAMLDALANCRKVCLRVGVNGEWLRMDLDLEPSQAGSQMLLGFEANVERIRRRLRRLYEGGHVLNFVRKQGGGSEIMLLLPLEFNNVETEYYAVY